MPDDRKLALFIDGDNINAQHIKTILDTAERHGKILIKRVYNNKSSQIQWEPIIGKYSLHPIWVPNNTKGKNSADIALVVDVMEHLYERKNLDGFCIISSDADFTALAKHIRTQDKFVLGMGGPSTPESFRNACTEFFTLNSEMNAAVVVQSVLTPSTAVTPSPVPEVAIDISDKEMIHHFASAYRRLAKKELLDADGGWTKLITIKTELIALKPVFESMNLRTLATRLIALANANPGKLEICEEKDGKPPTHLVRLLDGSEVDRFCQAYSHALIALKQGDQDNWVSLAVIGSVLVQKFANDDPLVYKNVKSAKLKSVVEKMVKDYPNLIEIQVINSHPHIRVKSGS